MPPKRVICGPQAPKPKEPKVLSCSNKQLGSFNDVAAMKADELKTLCRSHGIDETYPKKAKQIFLSNFLGLSTTGRINSETKVLTDNLSHAQLEEYEQLTIKKLCTIKDWTTDLTKVPDIEESGVKKYLLQTNNLTKETARTYKLSRPFQLKNSA